MTETQPTAPETYAPRAPLSFAGAALRGGLGAAGIQFLFGWLAFQVCTSLGWSAHLRSLTGSSSLPTYWGEFVTSRDLWEVLQHGELRAHPLGAWTTTGILLSTCWLLWFGWRMQAATAGVRPGFLPWVRGFGEALVLAILPLFLLRAGGMWVLGGLASTGIQPFGWLYVVGGALLHVTLGGLFMTQWWLCRLDLARPASAPNGWVGLWRHLSNSFLRLWLSPVHWGCLVVLGGLFRGGLFILTLFLAWRWGGGSVSRVLMAALLLGCVTLLNAWIIGWMMRLTAHFWRHDRRVRDEVQALHQNLNA